MSLSIFGNNYQKHFRERQREDTKDWRLKSDKSHLHKRNCFPGWTFVLHPLHSMFVALTIHCQCTPFITCSTFAPCFSSSLDFYTPFLPSPFARRPPPAGLKCRINRTYVFLTPKTANAKESPLLFPFPPSSSSSSSACIRPDQTHAIRCIVRVRRIEGQQ